MKSRRLGFTMIELIVVISIISILSAIALPNFLSWRASAKLNGAAQDLIADLSWAKSQALKNNRSTGVVFANSGYTIFDDANDNNVADSGEIIREKKYPAGVSMSAITFPYDKTQFTRKGSAGMGSITLSRGNGSRIIIRVNLVGRIRTEIIG